MGIAVLTKLLRNPCRILTLVHFFLSQHPRDVFRGAFPMAHSVFDYLFLLPFALGVAFMVWVLWKLGKQIKR